MFIYIERERERESERERERDIYIYIYIFFFVFLGGGYIVSFLADPNQKTRHPDNVVGFRVYG